MLFIGLLIVLSLDVFGTDSGFWNTLAAFFIHLTPALVLTLTLLLSWRYPVWGGILFPVFAVLYIVLTRGRIHWSAYAILSGTLLLTGVLFWIHWMHERRSDLHHG